MHVYVHNMYILTCTYYVYIYASCIHNMCVCVCVCVSVHTYIHIYIYIYRAGWTRSTGAGHAALVINKTINNKIKINKTLNR